MGASAPIPKLQRTAVTAISLLSEGRIALNIAKLAELLRESK
jgi:hypothetical protein